MEEDEQIAALKRWWDENGTFLLVTIVVVLGAFFGWRFYQDYQQERAEAAAALYQEYVELRETQADDTEEATARRRTLLERIETEFEGTSYHVFTLFFRAQDAVEDDEYEAAAGHLRTAVDAAGDDKLRDVARLRLARVQHELGNSEQALATLNAVSGAGFNSEAAEVKGDILLSRGDHDAAREAYQQALDTAGEDSTRTVLEMKLSNLARHSS